MAKKQPLLERIIESGYVLPKNAVSNQCVLNDNGSMQIVHQTGSLRSTRDVVLTINVTDIKAAIDEAASGTISEEILPADVPKVVYSAYQRGNKTPVMLFKQTSDSGKKKINESDAAIRLRNFIDANCGDSGQPLE